jgi:hypothetical protein
MKKINYLLLAFTLLIPMVINGQSNINRNLKLKDLNPDNNLIQTKGNVLENKNIEEGYGVTRKPASIPVTSKQQNDSLEDMYKGYELRD